MSINNPNKPILNNILSIAGEPLPDSLINALRNYKPTEFQTKNKEEILSMLIKNAE